MPSALARKMQLTRLALAWERAWPLLWPPLAIIGFYVAIALANGFAALPVFLHWLVALAALGGIGWYAWQAYETFEWPTRRDALRRLETRSGLAHRPLSSLEDGRAHFPGGREAGEALWERHLARVRAASARARTAPPSPQVARNDPLALRMAVLLLLGAALVYAGSEGPTRLAANLVPGGALSADESIAYDAWLTPPAYTGEPPLFLNTVEGEQGTEAAPLRLPENSVVTARIYGAARGEIRHGGERVPLEAADGGVREAEFTLTESGPLAIAANGRELAGFVVELIPDRPPEIHFTDGNAISLTAQLSLAIGYDLYDDYGISRAEMRVNLPDAETAARHGAEAGVEATTDIGALAEVDPPVLQLPLPSARTREAEGEFAYKDLTSHPWAGLQVAITLAAFDDAEQEGLSETRIMRLPQRTFTDPTARAVIEQRQRLAREPDAAPEVAKALNALTLHAERYYENALEYLPLRAAYWRLKGADRPGDLDGIYDLLWDIALYFEDGDLSLAESELRDARDALMEALARGAGPEELSRLIDDLRAAMDKFLQALAEQQMQAGQQNQMQANPNMQSIEQGQIEDMLDALQDLAQSGAEDAARELLSELSRILENLQAGQPGQMAMTPPQSAMNDAIQQMGDLINRQRGLQDETVQQDNGAQPPDGMQGQSGQQQGQQGQQGRPGEQQGQGGGSLSDRQEGLRGELGELREGLRGSGAEEPSALSRAERAMRDAEEAIAEGDLGRAARRQGEAIENLREGAQALAETLLEELAQQGGQGAQQQGMGPEGRDPLGRPQRSSGPQQGDGVEVPEESEIQRARRILEELQRRAGERDRPPVELDYLNRLLRRF